MVPTIIRTRVIVSGRVQGVWFRAATKAQAEALGLAGWVRNLPDGRTEAVFEGFAPLVQQAVQWCHIGPENAVVEHLEAFDEPVEGLKGFCIIG